MVLEDYLKFRGSLLLYVLAATADKKNNIARLAHELIIKFANEKNAILIRSCLRECPFAFNDCKLVDNSEMFGADLCLKSPLKSKCDDRRYIYRFLVHNLEVINCYMYFENFSTIKDRLTKKGFQKSPEFVDSIQDFLYICEHICKSKEIPKSKAAETGGAEGDDDGETAGPSTSKAPDVVAGSAPTSSKRNRQRTTLPEAMVVVEKAISRFPELSSTLVELDSEFKTTFDQICFAIGEHFGDSIKYFPHLFWDKYRKARSTKRVRRKNDGDDDSDDGNVSKLSKTPRRNEQRSSIKSGQNSMSHDTSTINDASEGNITEVLQTPQQNSNTEQRSTRKRTRSMATNDSGEDDNEDVSIPKTPKTIIRTAIKNMVIDDSDSDNDSLSTFKTPESVAKDTKRTTRRSKNY